MPIKEKSVFKKHEYEYESPDGDKYSITYIEHQDREYVEIGRQQPDGSIIDKVVWDVGMFKEVSKILDEIKGVSHGFAARGLTIPNIIDHRFGRAQIIERSVNDSMQRFDNNVQPVESFDSVRAAWQQNATGVDPSMIPEVKETPEEISIADKNPENLSQWQRDVLQRQVSTITKDPNKAIRRVGADDLV